MAGDSDSTSGSYGDNYLEDKNYSHSAPRTWSGRQDIAFAAAEEVGWVAYDSCSGKRVVEAFDGSQDGLEEVDWLPSYTVGLDCSS
jgi:hypothetical protein